MGLISLCGREFLSLALCQAVLWGYRLGQNPRPCHGVGAEGDDWGQNSWVGTAGDFGWHGCAHSYIHIPSYTSISWLIMAGLMYVDVYIDLAWWFPPGFHQPVVERLSISVIQSYMSKTVKLYPVSQCMLWMWSIPTIPSVISHNSQLYPEI